MLIRYVLQSGNVSVQCSTLLSHDEDGSSCMASQWWRVLKCGRYRVTWRLYNPESLMAILGTGSAIIRYLASIWMDLKILFGAHPVVTATLKWDDLEFRLQSGWEIFHLICIHLNKGLAWSSCFQHLPTGGFQPSLLFFQSWSESLWMNISSNLQFVHQQWGACCDWQTYKRLQKSKENFLSSASNIVHNSNREAYPHKPQRSVTKQNKHTLNFLSHLDSWNHVWNLVKQHSSCQLDFTPWLSCA